MSQHPDIDTSISLDEKLCKLIVENISDGVYLVDRNRVIRYWNRGAETLTGYKAEEVLGSSCSDNILMHVDETGKNLCKDGCPVSEAMEQGVSQTATVFLRHKKDIVFPF